MGRANNSFFDNGGICAVICYCICNILLYIILRYNIPQNFGLTSLFLLVVYTSLRDVPGKESIPSQLRSDRFWGPASLLLNGHQNTFPSVKWPGGEVNHSPPLPRLRSGGAVGVPILPLYGFMVCTGATSYLP